MIIVMSPDFSIYIRSAHNRKRVGTKDTYVAWSADEAKPPDLTFEGDIAWASL